MMVLTASCMTEKKASRRIAHLSVGHPTLLAQYCARTYPPVEKTTTTIEYRQGKNDTIWQAEYIDCDTIIGTDRVVKVPYPVIVPRRDTLIFRDSVFIENKAEISTLKLERDNYHAEVEKLKERAKNLLFGGFCAGAGLMFVLGVWFKKIY